MQIKKAVITAAGKNHRYPAGAPLAGLASRARDFIHVPVIDPIAAAVKQAEALVALGTIKASRGSFQRPAAKTPAGLSPKLTAYLEHAE